jgi:hypothetical protein
MYDPTNGRWLSQDPRAVRADGSNLHQFVGKEAFRAAEALPFIAGDRNLYRYVHNAPREFRDRLRLIDWPTLEAVRPQNTGQAAPFDLWIIFRVKTDKGNWVELRHYPKVKEALLCHGFTFGGAGKNFRKMKVTLSPKPEAVAKILEDE